MTPRARRTPPGPAAGWLPRLLTLGFVGSVFLPAPRFVTGLAEDEFLVWAARLCWVLVVPLLFALLLAAWSAIVRKRTG